MATVPGAKKGGAPLRMRTLKPPHKLFAADGNDAKCAFCLIPRSQRAVEGELLGPFDVRLASRIYAHRNCITWAPEVWFDEGQRIWHGVAMAYLRAKKYKCTLCGGLGASLGCMYNGKRCCRPMHFRCALLKGATLAVSPAFLTLCPVHADKGATEHDQPMPLELRAVQTPIPAALMEETAVVRCCQRDNYDLSAGQVLHCGVCGSGVHARCLSRDFEYGGALAVLSAKGLFRCEKCVQCDRCKRAIAVSPPSLLASHQLIRCRSCKHHVAHRSCVDGDLEKGWRCDVCRVCYHCKFMVNDHNNWIEEHQACPLCAQAIADNEAICPSCQRVWRDGLGGMIFCDGCDRWFHTEFECSNLTSQQLEVMTRTNKRYDCPKCTKTASVERANKILACSRLPKAAPRKRAPPKTKRASKTRTRARANRSDESSSELNSCYEQIVYGSSDEEHGACFRHFEKSSNIRSNLHHHHNPDVSTLVADAAPHTELCINCCTSGTGCSLRFCSECGEAFHGFCIDAQMPERVEGPLVSSHPGTRYRLAAGGLGVNARAWRCQSCTACMRCLQPDGNDVIILCDHCDRGVHLSCLTPPLESPPEGAFFCEECRYCEMCGIFTEKPNRIREHCFCHVCTPIVESGKACSICGANYPEVTRNEKHAHIEAAPEGTPEIQPMGLTAAKCCLCASVIHSECDLDFTSSPDYRCPPCRNAATTAVPMHCLTENGTAASVYSDVSGPTTPEDQGATVTKMIVHTNNSKHNDDEEMEIDLTAHKHKITNPSNQWCIDHRDRRRCELCLLGECGQAKKLGRLLPLPPDIGSNHQFMWVHAGCMLWSAEVSLMAGHSYQTGLYGSRRSLLALGRATTCIKCNKRGATVFCGKEKCRAKYHLLCAFQDGMRLEKPQDLQFVANQPLYCKNHCPINPDLLWLHQAQKLFNLARFLRVARIKELTSAQVQDTGPKELKKANAKPKTLVRVGALTVVSLGRLVPDSSEYIIGGSLVPTGYRATRMYWSMTTPGTRCMYCLEVSGDASTGPQFSIRSEEHPHNVIRGICVDEVWGSVRSRVKTVLGGDNTGNSLASCAQNGLEAFGLRKCRPVVTLVESLPMAWMFRKRYQFKYRHPKAADPEIERLLFGGNGFSLPSPKVNKTGSSRTEGYVPKRWRSRLNQCNKESPSYVNPCTGEQFQIRVAMESEGFGDYAPDVFGRHLAPPSTAAAASSTLAKRNKTDETLTALPPSRRYLMMRERLQRKDGHKIVVLRSRIEGMGVFATQPIRQGEFIIEYAGAEIRPVVSDLREKQYNDRSIGCYMFAIHGTAASKEIQPVVDATMAGNAARYINHSCDPNCESREIKNDKGKLCIVIVAIRGIRRGEELAYDYRLSPDSEDRAECVCGALKCRGFMDVEE